jgi:MarR family transcriptional regulator for hemolysin
MSESAFGFAENPVPRKPASSANSAPPRSSSEAYDRLFPDGSAAHRDFRFTRSFRNAFHIWRSMLEARLRESGITRAKWAVLSAVVLSDKGRNQNELARQLGIEGPTLVRLLDDLEAAGLVSRRQSLTDRRAKLIVAKKKGRDLADVLVEQTKDVRASFVSGLTDAEIKRLTTLLEKLIRTNR